MWYFVVYLLIIHLKTNPMHKKNKVLVDLELILHLSEVAQIFFNVIKENIDRISEDQIEKVEEAADLLTECNKLFENAINMNASDN